MYQGNIQEIKDMVVPNPAETIAEIQAGFDDNSATDYRRFYKDIIVSQHLLRVRYEPTNMGEWTLMDLTAANLGVGIMKEHAHKQLAERLKIPYRFYARKMEENPRQLERLVNEELERPTARVYKDKEAGERERFHYRDKRDDKKVLLRLEKTVTAEVRAYLSDKYRCIDHIEVASKVVPVLADMGFEIRSAGVTNERMYIKATSPRQAIEADVDDIVQMGVCVTNSEIGVGAFEVRPFAYRLICTNGMTAPTALAVFTQRHIGNKVNNESLLQYAEEYIRDSSGDTSRFMAELGVSIGDSKKIIIEDLTKTMEELNTVNPAVTLYPVEAQGIARYATEEAKGGKITLWDVVNGITRYAHMEKANGDGNWNYRRATELEQFGWEICSTYKR